MAKWRTPCYNKAITHPGGIRMNFGEKITNYRKILGLTQESLASQCSVTRQAVAKWEKGESIPDIYTIARLAKLFSVSIEELIHTDDAVVETQNFYIRRLQTEDKEAFCCLMLELGVLGRLYGELNKYSGDDTLRLGDKSIIEEYYPNAEHVFLLFHRDGNQAFGVFDLRELAEDKSEMSAYIRKGFEMDTNVFIDFFSWIKNEYSVRATMVSVWQGQEETLFESLGFKPADGICPISLPLV